MAAFATWLKDALIQTPGAQRSVVKRELVKAAREFYRDSAALREVIEPQAVLAMVSQYDLNSLISEPTLLEIGSVISVSVNDFQLRALTGRPHGEYEEASAVNSYYVTNTSTVNLWPRPTTASADAMTVEVALIPREDATSLPDIAATEHMDALMDGLLGRMFEHPAKPYSNPTLAQYHLKRFRSAIGVAAARIKTARAQGASWRFPPFGK